MPRIDVFFYCEAEGVCDILDWFRALLRSNKKAYANCLARLRLLQMQGHELRRPAADYLTDGIYELRAKHGTVQYRLLYFFHGRNVAVVAHALIKERTIPRIDIERAKQRRNRYEKDPTHHRFPRGIETLDAPP
jgi:phage-related protein